jgi:predicted RNA-binding protein YlqC (UPF0109 family)
MSSIDQQFIEYIVKSLVGHPDAVTIERRIDEKGVLLELTVDPEDLGRVIGKRGATAQSLRTLLRALGTKNEARYNLKIIDNGDPRPPRDDAPVTQSDDTTSNQDDDAHDESSNQQVEEKLANTDNWSTTTAVRSSASKDLDLDDDDVISKGNSDKLSKTRKELNDLDDLDI